MTNDKLNFTKYRSIYSATLNMSCNFMFVIFMSVNFMSGHLVRQFHVHQFHAWTF